MRNHWLMLLCIALGAFISWVLFIHDAGNINYCHHAGTIINFPLRSCSR